MKLHKVIKKTFPMIQNRFSMRGLQAFSDTPYPDLHFYHFTLGLWIRNNLLGGDSVLYQTFLEYGITDRDDMSIYIVNMFYTYVQTGEQ